MTPEELAERDHGTVIRIYRLEFAGSPAIASVTDGSDGSLFITVAVNPTPEADEWIHMFGAGF